MPDAPRPSLYELLGVPPDASEPDLARAYRRRARELHPDRALAGTGAEPFAALTQAYRLLSDPHRRAAYDATLREPRTSERPTPDAIPVPIRRSASPAPPLHPLTIRGRQSPIVAGPTHIYPNGPKES
jgi:curved DNA-binding protein CbpA